MCLFWYYRMFCLPSKYYLLSSKFQVMAVLNLNIEFLLFFSNALAIECSDPKEPIRSDTHI